MAHVIRSTTRPRRRSSRPSTRRCGPPIKTSASAPSSSLALLNMSPRSGRAPHGHHGVPAELVRVALEASNFVVVLTEPGLRRRRAAAAASHFVRHGVETDDAARDEEQRQQPDAARVVSDAEHAGAFVPRRPFPELEALGRRAQGRQ